MIITMMIRPTPPKTVPKMMGRLLTGGVGVGVGGYEGKDYENNTDTRVTPPIVDPFTKFDPRICKFAFKSSAFYSYTSTFITVDPVRIDKNLIFYCAEVEFVLFVIVFKLDLIASTMSILTL